MMIYLIISSQRTIDHIFNILAVVMWEKLSWVVRGGVRKGSEGRKAQNERRMTMRVRMSVLSEVSSKKQKFSVGGLKACVDDVDVFPKGSLYAGEVRFSL